MNTTKEIRENKPLYIIMNTKKDKVIYALKRLFGRSYIDFRQIAKVNKNGVIAFY